MPVTSSSLWEITHIENDEFIIRFISNSCFSDKTIVPAKLYPDSRTVPTQDINPKDDRGLSVNRESHISSQSMLSRLAEGFHEADEAPSIARFTAKDLRSILCEIDKTQALDVIHSPDLETDNPAHSHAICTQNRSKSALKQIRMSLCELFEPKIITLDNYLQNIAA